MYVLLTTIMKFDQEFALFPEFFRKWASLSKWTVVNILAVKKIMLQFVQAGVVVG